MGISIKDFCKRTAEISIGASTLRNHPKNTIRTVRNYLKDIDLQNFKGINSIQFFDLLDNHTISLQAQIQELDKSALYWGSARKSLNLFLGAACYHAVLRPYYELDKIEKYFEVPLDRQVSKGLIEKASTKQINLPKWISIKDLTPENNKVFQDFALNYAEEINCTRIQLDILLWRAGENSEI